MIDPKDDTLSPEEKRDEALAGLAGGDLARGSDGGQGNNVGTTVNQVTEVHTAGGASVGGDLYLDKGDFVGRDKILNIDIRLLPVVLGLGALAVVLAYFLLRTDIPEAMDSEFNIAVAGFQVVDENGKAIRSDEGEEFGNWLYGRVDKGMGGVLDELYEGTYLVWSPAYTGVVSGETAAEREQNAQARAEEIGADVVIYGNIVPLGSNQYASVEFFVNHDSFDEGEDIKGGHDFGDALPIGNPFDEALVSVENPPLSARAQALSLVTIGLAYYAVDDFEKAIQYFEEADGLAGWLNHRSTGKHVAKLLLGNAYVRLASREKAPEYLPQARAYYGEALEIDNEYARAEVGRAGVYYLLALGDPYDAEASSRPDLGLLSEAEAAFEHALTLERAPAGANVERKVQFGLGQIYLWRFALEGGEWLEQAKAQFRAVTGDYEAGNEQIEDLAAHAYARLGLISDQIEEDSAAALAYYERAAALASPFYRAEYQAKVGDLHAARCEMELAQTAYLEARDYAAANADQESFSRYSDKLSDLAEMDSCTHGVGG